MLYRRTDIAMDNALELLDDVERRIESHRERAAALAEEGRHLLATLADVGRALPKYGFGEADLEDLTATLSRLERRARTVTVEVATARDETQREALDKMEALMQELVDALQEGAEGSADRLQRYGTG